MADRTIDEIITALQGDVYGKAMRADIVELATVLNDTVEDAVEHQLITVDATLTQSGQGADAAATGAALGNKADYYNPTFSGKLNQNGVGTLGYCATTLGNQCKAGAPMSISAGNECETKSTAGASVALGDHTVTHALFQLACGSYNEEDTDDDYLVVVGNGDENARSNAATVGTDGNAWFAGNVKVGGSKYSDPNAKELATKNYVEDYVDSHTGATIGQFTQRSGFTPQPGSYVNARQIGKIVFVEGCLISATNFGDVMAATNGYLGDIDFIGTPYADTKILGFTTNGSGTITNALIGLIHESNYVAFKILENAVSATDNTLYFQGFYFVD